MKAIFLSFCFLFPFVLLFGQVTDPEPTLITSERLEMQGTTGKNYFYFTGAVRVEGTNLEILCEELTVVAGREGPEQATIGRLDAIDQIIAAGAVEIHQAGRSAYAQRAEVDPVAGTVTLSGSPRIVDGDVEVEGYQFVLHKGERKFVSIPDPNAPSEAPSRSVVRLGAMPDLGFDQEEASISVDDRIGTEAPDDATSDPSMDSGAGEEGDGEQP